MPEKNTERLPWDTREPRKFVWTEEFKERCELLIKAGPQIYYLVVYPLLRALKESEEQVKELLAEKILREVPHDPQRPH